MENFLFSILWSSSHWHFVCIQHILCWKLQNIRNRKLSIPWCILVENHHGILDLFSNKIIIFIFPYSVSGDFFIRQIKTKIPLFYDQYMIVSLKGEKYWKGILISYILFFKWRAYAIFCGLLSLTFSDNLPVLSSCFKIYPTHSGEDVD